MKKTLLLLSMLSIGSINAVKITNDTQFPNKITWQKNGKCHYCTLKPNSYLTLDNITQVQVSKFKGKYNSPLLIPASSQNSPISIQSVLTQYNKQNQTLNFRKNNQLPSNPNSPEFCRQAFFLRKQKKDLQQQALKEIFKVGLKKEQTQMDKALFYPRVDLNKSR